MGWTAYAKDRFLAPKLSELTSCGARELIVSPDESRGYIAGFILTSALRVNIPDPMRQLMLSFLRRVDAAVLDYTTGRAGLLDYLANRRDVGFSYYSRCLQAFEMSVAMTYQAWSLARYLDSGHPPLYERDDGSVLHRLDKVYNASRHADSLIANARAYPPDSTLPVWLTNTGLESIAQAVTFDELADQIESLARIASSIATLDPASRDPEEA